IVEGMLAQRPVVAARAGGVLEIVDDYENGVLCTPGDAHGLADALAELRSNDELRNRLVRNGYQTALSRFGTAAYVEGVERILKRVTGPKTA
ncbi:MAG: glycosyltransferase, partial [Paraburkholderia nemoris]